MEFLDLEKTFDWVPHELIWMFVLPCSASGHILVPHRSAAKSAQGTASARDSASGTTLGPPHKAHLGIRAPPGSRAKPRHRAPTRQLHRGSAEDIALNRLPQASGTASGHASGIQPPLVDIAPGTLGNVLMDRHEPSLELRSSGRSCALMKSLEPILPTETLYEIGDFPPILKQRFTRPSYGQSHFTVQSVGLHPPNTSSLDHVRNEDVQKVLGMAPIIEKMKEAHLYWDSHVVHSGEESSDRQHCALAQMDGDHMFDQRRDEWTEKKKKRKYETSQHSPRRCPRLEEVESEMPISRPCNSAVLAGAGFSSAVVQYVSISGSLMVQSALEKNWNEGLRRTVSAPPSVRSLRTRTLERPEKIKQPQSLALISLNPRGL
ncbi:uncharacterized protein LOC122136815 [Cyprinus carpio]|uniref:Uncharacterized protein LOC122136815 n=1 Tax=Cyprinus carpio TaxID=7962 RepID=A0A9Q9W5S3_CYPCA|nr:uncharacterized protein LOC122136815 [Cyprinus carpio]